MSARDVYHSQVRNALVKDGWTITHDPYVLTFGQKDVFVDIGAERVIAAEKGSEKIAVEIKSFRGASDIRDLAGDHCEMDNVEQYRQVIREIIQEYAQFRPLRGDVEIEIIFDEANDHYELMYSGWNGPYRIHGSVLHIDIRNGKI
jgi:hypothetical protein